MSYLRDAKTVSSVADAYKSMYAKPNEDILNEELIDSLIEDVRDEEINEWLEYLEEVKSVISVPKQNVKKVRYALTKLSKRHPKVKVTFGTQSKGKFVDDNNINFDGSHSDIDNLFKAIQKDKPLLKMMENTELEEGALADKAKKSGISVGTLRKVYNRGMAAWKTGHRPGTTPQQWGHARVNAFIVKKKKGGLNHDKDLAHVVHPDDSMLDESFSKKMPLKTYADRIGINDKEKQWIMDNEKDEPMYFPNDKFQSSLVLSYPVRNGDYYFSFLTDMDSDSINQAKQTNLKMNLLLQKEYKKAFARSKIDFKKEPEKLYALSGYLWNIMTKAFDKLPRNLGAGDTMTRDELFLAIDHLVGAEPRFESYDYQGETIQEGKLTGILGTIANKIRSAKKKVMKKIRLGRVAKDFSDVKKENYGKYDANILKSVADTYASMQNYGIQGDIVEETQLDEVKRQEVDAMKKVSKDMQSVLKSYQKIANMGDKELKNTVHNKSYKQVLDARDTILKMIGTLNTKMLMQKENFELVEASAGEMIDKLFNLKGNKDAGYGVAKMLSMTGVKVIQAMQKQNPQGFMKTVIALGKEKGKMQIPTNNALMKMFKQQGVKPIPEALDNNDKPKVKEIIKKLKGASKAHAGQAKDLEKAVSEKVKDGKLDPLSKMGKSKLTGSEVQQYYRDNPKQKTAARDKTVKKAIELALDLSGNMKYAMKEIEKLKRGLSRLPAVKLALQHANESKEFTGHHVIIENLSSTDLIKLKTYGKMLAKMTKLQFDDSKPEQSIDKLMGQIWKQKHVPANWERLHKMVALLNKIGVKMPSLKGKYMGLDPVSKKAIFYKEGTDEIVDWNKDISEIKEGIEEIVEAQEMKDADVKKIAQMTDRNDHNGSLMHLAKVMGDRKSLDALKGIMQTHKALGHMPKGLIDTRMSIFDDLMKQSKKKYRNHNDIYSAL